MIDKITFSGLVNSVDDKNTDKKVYVPYSKMSQAPDTFEKTTQKEVPPPSNYLKTAGIALAATLSGVGVTAAVLKGRSNKLVSNAQDWAKKGIAAAEEKAKKMVTDVEEKAQKDMEAKVKVLQEQFGKDIQKINDDFNNTVDGKYVDELKGKINKIELDYDPTKPPAEEVVKSTDGMEFLPLQRPAARAEFKEIEIPDFFEGKAYNFEVPVNGEIKPSTYTRGNINTVSKNETTISMDYANSVQWNNDKISRDLLQNFYDGHGQTLDGVKINYTPTANGKYKVRIEGKGEYSHDKAILLGESSKRDDGKAAGNYGEGLKMTVLKLLKDCGSSDVKIASDNWKVTYEAGKGKIGKDVLKYSVDEVTPQKGNYLEFETDNVDFLNSLKSSINRFYHSSNKDFNNLDFENNLFAIKTLPEGEKGGIYMNGQKFEFDGSYEGLDGANIFFKEKIPAKKQYSEYSGEEVVFDPSRDRVSMNEKDLKNIMKYFADNEGTSKEEVQQALLSLEKYWAKTEKDKPLGKAVAGILDGVCYCDNKRLKINFPEKYIAATCEIDDALVDDLSKNGYVICQRGFADIGMQNITAFLKEQRNHLPSTPTDLETKKIALLREAVQALSPKLEKEGYFKANELNPKVYIFDHSKQGTNYTDGTLAEAIIKRGGWDKKTLKILPDESNGYWIEKGYLDKCSFDDMLSTALHEMTHKFGGDGSAAFGYKLTDVLGRTIESATTDKVAVEKLRAIAKVWNELE